MSNGLTTEIITNRPPAGLSLVEMALLGLETASEKVEPVLPELFRRPPSGLSTMEWARLGLPSAIEKVRNATTTYQ